MKNTYELIQLELGGEVLKRIDANGIISWIPIDPANSDYQAYLNKDTLASELSNPSTPQAGE
jgi:hypothetical protein